MNDIFNFKSLNLDKVNQIHDDILYRKENISYTELKEYLKELKKEKTDIPIFVSIFIILFSGLLFYLFCKEEFFGAYKIPYLIIFILLLIIFYVFTLKIEQRWKNNKILKGINRKKYNFCIKELENNIYYTEEYFYKVLDEKKSETLSQKASSNLIGEENLPVDLVEIFEKDLKKWILNYIFPKG